jgi:hypothetical protein
MENEKGRDISASNMDIEDVLMSMNAPTSKVDDAVTISTPAPAQSSGAQWSDPKDGPTMGGETDAVDEAIAEAEESASLTTALKSAHSDSEIAAEGAEVEETDDDEITQIQLEEDKQQQHAEHEEKITKPKWESSTVRGRFYSDLYIPVDETIQDKLRGEVFVPVTVPYLFQFANEFKHKKAWMDIVGIKKEEQERVYSELWRDDCTHSQQWSAESGCCGLSCCLIGGHRKDTVGLRGKKL